MRINLKLEPCAPPLVLNIQYNQKLQGLVYSLFDDMLGRFLHDKGFSVEKRHFRMFAFSRLMGRYELDRSKKTIAFFDKVNLVISSPFDLICSDLAGVVIRKERVSLGGEKLRISSVSIDEPKVNSGNIVVKSLSPITAYSTMYKTDGSKYTHYYHPKEPDFAKVLQGNLEKKYRIVNGEAYNGRGLQVIPIGRTRENVVLYRNGVIKGYSGQFRLQAEPRLLQIGIDAGFGSKNSQGFGMCELKSHGGNGYSPD